MYNFFKAKKILIFSPLWKFFDFGTQVGAVSRRIKNLKKKKFGFLCATERTFSRGAVIQTRKIENGGHTNSDPTQNRIIIL